VYVRADPDRVEEVAVSRPSDALAARAAAGAFTSLLLGLAAALLIGALAGLYPAARAARLPTTEALRSA
jgi:ABC-type nitrate/sulfonate/bicarbonate transport system permease component